MDLQRKKKQQRTWNEAKEEKRKESQICNVSEHSVHAQVTFEKEFCVTQNTDE